jgi:hypothetical protein
MPATQKKAAPKKAAPKAAKPPAVAGPKFNLYTFTVTGGSPSNGVVVVAAARKSSAQSQARKAVQKLNEGLENPRYSLVDEEPSKTETVSLPAVVYVESGER